MIGNRNERIAMNNLLEKFFEKYYKNVDGKFCLIAMKNGKGIANMRNLYENYIKEEKGGEVGEKINPLLDSVDRSVKSEGEKSVTIVIPEVEKIIKDDEAEIEEHHAEGVEEVDTTEPVEVHDDTHVDDVTVTKDFDEEHEEKHDDDDDSDKDIGEVGDFSTLFDDDEDREKTPEETHKDDTSEPTPEETEIVDRTEAVKHFDDEEKKEGGETEEIIDTVGDVSAKITDTPETTTETPVDVTSEPVETIPETHKDDVPEITTTIDTPEPSPEETHKDDTPEAVPTIDTSIPPSTIDTDEPSAETTPKSETAETTTHVDKTDDLSATAHFDADDVPETTTMDDASTDDFPSEIPKEIIEVIIKELPSNTKLKYDPVKKLNLGNSVNIEDLERSKEICKDLLERYNIHMDINKSGDGLNGVYDKESCFKNVIVPLSEDLINHVLTDKSDIDLLQNFLNTCKPPESS